MAGAEVAGHSHPGRRRLLKLLHGLHSPVLVPDLIETHVGLVGF